MIMLTDTNQLETILTNPASYHLVKYSKQSFEHNFKYQCFSEINIFKGHIKFQIDIVLWELLCECDINYSTWKKC
jgi:hypothetical protein